MLYVPQGASTKNKANCGVADDVVDDDWDLCQWKYIKLQKAYGTFSYTCCLISFVLLAKQTMA